MAEPIPEASAPARKRERGCLCHWCRRPAAEGTVLCQTHLQSLPIEMRANLGCALLGAVSWIAADRMRRAVATLPKATQDRMREETRDL